jgi:cell division inhibitor SulA
MPASDVHARRCGAPVPAARGGGPGLAGPGLDGAAGAVRASGHAALDAELPGGGWPCGALTELLQPQPALLEWRLLGPVARALAAEGRPIVLVGPPQVPHLPGLAQCGLPASALVWVQAQTTAERLWCTEQLLRAQAAALVLAWLPQARPEQIRRLQVNALGSEALVFACRPWRRGRNRRPPCCACRPGWTWTGRCRCRCSSGAGRCTRARSACPRCPAAWARCCPAACSSRGAGWRPAAARCRSPWRCDRRRPVQMPMQMQMLGPPCAGRRPLRARPRSTCRGRPAGPCSSRRGWPAAARPCAWSWPPASVCSAGRSRC